MPYAQIVNDLNGSDIHFIPTVPLFEIDRVTDYAEFETLFLSESVFLFDKVQPLDITFRWQTGILGYTDADGRPQEADYPSSYSDILDTLKYLHKLPLPGQLTGGQTLEFTVPNIIRFSIDDLWLNIRGVVKKVKTTLLPPYYVLPHDGSYGLPKYEYLPHALDIELQMQETYLYSTETQNFPELYQSLIQKYGDLQEQGQVQRTGQGVFTGVKDKFYGKITP